LVAFRSKEYSGWNIEAKECGVVQSPIGDVDFLGMSSASGMAPERLNTEEEDDEDDVPLW
jgi:hypothetical protein